EVLPHPSRFPNLPLTDFHFFRLLVNFLIQKRFRKQEDIENAIQQILSLFHIRRINNFVIDWQKCTEHYRNYLK
ncbi:Histone-lysine N-methyltransferase SETMAR, partial [Habropoda laboriosa]